MATLDDILRSLVGPQPGGQIQDDPVRVAALLAGHSVIVTGAVARG